MNSIFLSILYALHLHILYYRMHTLMDRNTYLIKQKHEQLHENSCEYEFVEFLVELEESKLVKIGSKMSRKKNRKGMKCLK